MAHKLVTNDKERGVNPPSIFRRKLKGAPGLAFETWDPCNPSPMETPLPLCHPECWMGLRPTQGDEKSLRPATTLYRTVAPSFVIPSAAEGSAVRPSCAPR